VRRQTAAAPRLGKTRNQFRLRPKLLNEDSTSGVTAILEEYRVAAAAEAAYLRNDWASAAPLYQKATALNPERGEYWYRSALAFYKLRDFDQAIVGFQHAAKLGQNKVWSLYDLSACHG
jgi:tetratricopeptide (TPR) repeat protein